MEEDWGFFVDIDEQYIIQKNSYKSIHPAMFTIPEDYEVYYGIDNDQFTYNKTEIMNNNIELNYLGVFKKGQFNNNLVHGLIVLALIRVVLFVF